MDLLRIFISLFLGLAIGYLIINLTAINHTVMRGPDSNVIKNTIHHDSLDDAYYKLTPYVVLSRGKHICQIP